MYDEAAAKASYIQQLKSIASTQDLSEDLRTRTRNLSIVFAIIAAVFVGLRFLTRLKQSLRPGTDDWLILLSLLLLAGCLTQNLFLIDDGLGLHSGALTLDQLQRLSQTIVGAEILYVLAVSMYKISLLFLYFRIFPTASIRTAGYICGGLSTAWTIACIFASIFQCSPRERLWKPWLEGTCINVFLTQLCIAVPTILFDIAILCLPIPHVWRLRTNLTQRILLTFVFLLGSYVVFTSIYRFKTYLSYRADDVPYTLATGCAWNIIEISSGIVSATLPTLGPLGQYFFTSLYPTSRSASKTGTGGYRNKQSNIVTIGGSGAEDKGLKRDQCNVSRENRKYGIVDEDAMFVPYRGKMTTTVSRSRPDSGGNSSDEIPLTAIRQKRQVEWTEERVSTGNGVPAGLGRTTSLVHGL